MNTKSEFLNEKAVADFLGMQVRTIQDWRQRGRGPRFVKFGKAVRYSRTDVLDFATAGLRQSTKD
jgi:predicted DNA-binding transcriptional regulator AlpA